LILFAIGGAAGLIAAAASPNTYTSVARLRLRAGKVETFSLEELLGVGSDRPTAMSTVDEIFLLGDPQLYQQVVDEVGGPQQILIPPDPTSYDTTDTPLHIAALHRIQKALFGTFFKPHCNDKNCVQCRQLAATLLQARTTLIPEKASNVITLEHLSFSPELAERTADLLVKASVARHKQEFAVKQYYGMNDKAIEDTGKALDAAKLAYEQHRQECGFIDIEVQKGNLLAQLQKIAIDTQTNGAELVGVQMRLATMRKQLEATSETVKKISVYEQKGISPDWTRWEARVNELRSKLSDVDLEVTASREVRDQKKAILNDKIKYAEEQYNKFDQEKMVVIIPEQSADIPNDAWFSLYSRIQMDEAEEGRLTALIAANNKAHDETVADLDKLLKCERLHDSWDLEIKEKEENYQKLSAKNAELDALGQLDVQPEANLRIFQAPTLPLDKDGPKRSKFVGLGLFGGLAVGLGIALLVQFLDRRLRYPGTVERELKLPIIGIVPEVPALHGIIRRQRVA
jgi:uncharacterized protein involved in exopolysaccharide biosynthesis